MNFKSTGFSRSIFTLVHTVGSAVYSKKISNLEKHSLTKIDKYHHTILKNELKEAINDVSFYNNDVYKKALEGNDLDSLLKSLPVIDKFDILEHKDSFVNKKKLKGCMSHNTSGTTGVPMRIYSSIPEKLYAHSIILNQVKKVTGIWGMRDTLYISGFFVNPNIDDENLYVRDKVFNNTYLSIYNLSNENADRYLQILKDYQPKIIFGYASSISELSTIISHKNDNIDHNVQLIISTAEVLTEDFRENIESVFNVKVSDMYGSQEGGHFAFECKYGVKHINPARGIIEVKNEEGISRTGNGEAIITAINRPSFPLYRYNLKDVIEIQKPLNKCKCGLHTYVIGKLDGRKEDMVITSDDRKITFLTDRSTKDVIGLKQAQIIQTDYEKFIIKCIFNNELKNLEKQNIKKIIKKNIEDRIGLVVDIDFQEVEEIEKSSKGKVKAVIVQKFPRNKEK